MFAHDRGWLRRMKEAIKRGMTAEAAVERVQNDTRARMLRQADTYWRERLRDLDELSDRLLRILAGRPRSHAATANLPHDTVLIARTMGAADLLDYDRSRLRGLVLEDSGGQSHVAIVAKALGIAAVGNARGVMERVDHGNPIIVDADTGEVHIRPSSEVIAAYGDKARFRARRHRKYRALRDRPAITKDGQRIELHINAGLLMDVPHLAESGADGIGLFRTELQFMVSATLPRLERQTQMYRAVVAEAGQKPVVFRTLDVGGDKVLPYLRQPAGGEPRARLARHPPRPRSAGPAAHPGPRPVARHRRPRAAPAAADGDRRRRGRHGPCPHQPRARPAAPPRHPVPDQGAARRHDRGAVAALRARRAAAARRLRVRRQQRPAAVFLRRRPQQPARRRAATMRSRPPRCGRSPPSSRPPGATTGRSACAARWRAGRSRPWR